MPKWQGLSCHRNHNESNQSLWEKGTCVVRNSKNTSEFAKLSVFMQERFSLQQNWLDCLKDCCDKGQTSLWEKGTQTYHCQESSPSRSWGGKCFGMKNSYNEREREVAVLMCCRCSCIGNAIWGLPCCNLHMGFDAPEKIIALPSKRNTVFGMKYPLTDQSVFVGPAMYRDHASANPPFGRSQKGFSWYQSPVFSTEYGGRNWTIWTSRKHPRKTNKTSHSIMEWWHLTQLKKISES